MRVANSRVVALVAAVSGVFALFGLLGLAAPGHETAGARTAAGVIAVLLGTIAIRAMRCGLQISADAVVVRSIFWSRRIDAAAVRGVAIEPVLRRRRCRLDVVEVSGELVPVVFAAWRMGSSELAQQSLIAAHAVAGVVPAARPSVLDVVTAAGRLEHPGAFSYGDVVVPAVTRAPVLSPRTVTPVADPASRKLLGWETVAVTIAFALPAVVAAIAVFARHVARVSNLDEFDLPLPHDLPASLALMVLLYLTTAVTVPIALVLLARGGIWPRQLGLSWRWLRLDGFAGVGLLLGTWASEFVLLAPFSPLLHHSELANSSHNTHVPAYFVVYAVVVSLTTAVNEEVLVNGYLLTRLSQLGWRPWSAFALSLAVRTSYHAYYGIAIIATVPFGWWATRSFQKHGRLTRPIVAHFLNDAVLLTIAVLAS